MLTTIAPEIEPDDIRDDVLLRDQVDLDSMDWPNFLRGIDGGCTSTSPKRTTDRCGRWPTWSAMSRRTRRRPASTSARS